MNPVPKSLKSQQGVHFPLTDADYIHKNYNHDHAVKVLVARASKKIQQEEQKRVENLTPVYYA